LQRKEWMTICLKKAKCFLDVSFHLSFINLFCFNANIFIITTETFENICILMQFVCIVLIFVTVKPRFYEILSTTFAHKQHDVIWKRPVWNIKIRLFFGFVYTSIFIKFH
jgi:hypothetical protein